MFRVFCLTSLDTLPLIMCNVYMIVYYKCNKRWEVLYLLRLVNGYSFGLSKRKKGIKKSDDQVLRKMMDCENFVHFSSFLGHLTFFFGSKTRTDFKFSFYCHILFFFFSNRNGMNAFVFSWTKIVHFPRLQLQVAVCNSAE